MVRAVCSQTGQNRADQLESSTMNREADPDFAGAVAEMSTGFTARGRQPHFSKVAWAASVTSRRSRWLIRTTRSGRQPTAALRRLGRIQYDQAVSASSRNQTFVHGGPHGSLAPHNQSLIFLAKDPESNRSLGCRSAAAPTLPSMNYCVYPRADPFRRRSFVTAILAARFVVKAVERLLSEIPPRSG